MYPTLTSTTHDSRSDCCKWLADQKLPPPLIVGGTGGSGTRVLVQMLRELGLHMGSSVNASEDAMHFVPLYDRWINPYLASEATAGDLDEPLGRALRQHCLDIPAEQPWGWKNPRSIYLWPAFAKLLPSARFLHVVRDGIAMSNSANQNQLKLHGHAILDEHTLHLASADQSLRLWATVNTAAADFGEKLGRQYIRVRYEDAVAQPLSTLRQLAAFLEVPMPHATHVQMQPVRSRSLTADDFAPEVVSQTTPALQRFGYTAC